MLFIEKKTHFPLLILCVTEVGFTSPTCISPILHKPKSHKSGEQDRSFLLNQSSCLKLAFLSNSRITVYVIDLFVFTDSH